MGQSVEPQPRHKIRTLLTLFTSKKPEPRNVLPSGDLPMGKSSVFVFATATRNEPATARLFSTSFIWTSVQIFRVLGMSCAVFLWNFFLFEDPSKCFRPDQRVRFELAWRFFYLFISNSSSIFGKFMRRLPPNSRTFSPRPEFFQIS